MAQLWQFWMRKGGSTTAVYRLNPLSRIPLGEQLLCALVRRDKTRATEIMQSPAESWMPGFVQLLRENALASFSSCIFNSLQLRDLVGTISMSTLVDNSESGRLVGKSTLQVVLQRMSAIETSQYDEFDDRFLVLLDHLAPMKNDLLWPKGISLSRTLYEEPFHRWSGDFDCVVPKMDALKFVQLCLSAGYAPVYGDRGFCNQIEVGPTASFDDLFCSPSPQMTPSSVIGMSKRDFPLIDPKFNPLDRGLVCKESERFFADAVTITWRDRTFLAPSTIDHLMIALVHSEKDRFCGWKSLIDIDLLAKQIEKENGWKEFVRRCQAEGVRLSAWAGLVLVVDRFATPVPQAVIDELEPPARSLSTYFSFAIEPLFYWNCASVTTLLLNVWFTADRRRKEEALAAALLPSREFLAQYYAQGRPLNSAEVILLTLLHWCVLALPGLLVRNTFGPLLWEAQRQYSEITSNEKLPTSGLP
jgi:hypothetical protein